MEGDSSTDCLLLIQQMHTQGNITDDQRDDLKDMVFEEDGTLLSFFARYTEADEQEELQDAVLKYITMRSGAAQQQDPSTGTDDNLDEMSSPMDAGIGMKKRMAQMKAAKARVAKAEETAKPSGGMMSIGNCDIGASPEMSKGSMFAKKFGRR